MEVEKSFEVEQKLEPASPNSEYFLSEVAKLYVLSIFELENPINSSEMNAWFSGAFLDSHPRFSCIPIEDKKGRKMWKKVKLNVEDHIKTLILPEGLTLEKYSEHLDDYMSKIATSEFEENKPLWEAHIFNYPTKNATSTLIIKIHHAVGDGASLMGIVFTCFKRVDDPTLPLTFPSTTSATSITTKTSKKTTMIRTFNIAPKFLSSFFYSLYDFGQTLRVVLFEDDRTPIRSGKTNTVLPCSTRVCSVHLSLSDVKRIKSALKVTVNDVIVGIIAIATQLYIRGTEQGKQEKKRMTASIAINVRSNKRYTTPEDMRKTKTWGNKFSMTTLSIPNLREDDLKNPLKIVMKIHKTLKKKRSSFAPSYLSTWTLKLTRTLGGFKAAAQTVEKGWKNSSLTISNLIGPIEHMSIGNHPIKGFYFVATGMNLSLATTVMSYVDKLRVGLVVENGFIDHQRLTTCVENAFHLIHQAVATASVAK